MGLIIMSEVATPAPASQRELVKPLGLGIIGGFVGTLAMSLVDIILVLTILPFEYTITDFAYDFFNAILPGVFPQTASTKGLLHLSIGLAYGLAIGVFFVVLFSQQWLDAEETPMMMLFILGIAWGLLTQVISIVMVLFLKLAPLESYVGPYGIVQLADHVMFGIVAVMCQAIPRFFKK